MLIVGCRDRVRIWYDLVKGVATIAVCVAFTMALFMVVAISRTTVGLMYKGCEKARETYTRNRRLVVTGLTYLTRNILPQS
ncbi:hypothetical protein LSH36_867g00030 [Paralvinella palmiformis]|uniref:Uncharacterized protein n=1 Tax=Paralvinella palmiformis TaxID=53620 RepID=A0AAD9MRX5_9ANNE|nr:hypothetical protein LSH36_867g00030 [Paralvinella palmiformis]